MEPVHQSIGGMRGLDAGRYRLNTATQGEQGARGESTGWMLRNKAKKGRADLKGMVKFASRVFEEAAAGEK